MTTATNIATPGFVCATLQRSHGEIMSAIATLGIKPSVTINGVDHYSDADVQRLAAHFAQRELGGAAIQRKQYRTK